MQSMAVQQRGQGDPGKGAPPKGQGPGVSQTVFQDLFRGDLKRSFGRDFRDLYHFYLDDEARARLAKMGAFKRAFFFFWWLLKGLILKLPPARRLLLLLAFILMLFQDVSFQAGDVHILFGVSWTTIGLLLIILMLELKDKLLARDELAVGRAVQLALMPTSNPVVAGWDIWLFTRPANDVGGDLVDYMELGDGQVGIALGDVSGKGLGAALLMAKLQSTLRAFAGESEALPDLGSRVNRILCRDGLPGRFATLLFLALGSHSGQVRVMNAGHMPPVVLREDGPETLPPVAPVLGILNQAEFVEQRLALSPGDLLLVYSDGLTEAMNERNEFYGEERLYAVLPPLRGLAPGEVGERLLKDVSKFVGEEHTNDDLSLIVVKRAGLPEPPADPARAAGEH
jgi:hypothetical protein